VSVEEAVKSRPLRFTYRHLTCGGTTRVDNEIARVFATTPRAYSSAYCHHCRRHFPVDEFVWLDGWSVAV
jgi:hypothetical protein